MARQNTGQAPYGFRWEDDRLVPHPEEAATRLRLFELFAGNPNKGAAARALSDEGHRTRRGGQWTDMAVGRLLACTSAKGLYAVNRTATGEDGERVALPESEWDWVTCERIVPEALWERVQSLLNGAASPPAVARRGVVHPFAGVLFCACGERMRVPSNSPKYVCAGSCATKIPEDDMEGIFQGELERFLKGREELLAELERRPPDGNPPTKIAAADFVRHWLEFTPKTRRGIIGALVERIVVGDGKMDFVYRFGDSDPKTRWRSTCGAGSGNRTRITSLEGWGFTIKLYPRWWQEGVHGSRLGRVSSEIFGGIVRAGRFWCGNCRVIWLASGE
ncbi:hypothetical protein BH23VER1_BH23VER1_24310 [soil metagenome]